MSFPDVPGNSPIIATPFTPDGAVDYDSLRSELRFIADTGCQAATLFGIASEFYKLSDAERTRLVEVTTEVSDEVGLSPVISVTHESTVMAVEDAAAYENAGAECIMVFPPRFGNPPKQKILDHVRAIADTVDVPIMVQHTPMNVAVSPAEWAGVYEEFPNVRYFKIEVDNPGQYIADLFDEADEDIVALVGSAGVQMIEGYDRGARGVMPAAVYEEFYNAIHEAYVGGDRERAVEMHTDLLGVLNAFRGIDSSKYLLAERGIIESPHCREPTSGIGDSVNEDLHLEVHDRMMGLIEAL